MSQLIWVLHSTSCLIIKLYYIHIVAKDAARHSSYFIRHKSGWKRHLSIHPVYLIVGGVQILSLGLFAVYLRWRSEPAKLGDLVFPFIPTAWFPSRLRLNGKPNVEPFIGVQQLCMRHSPLLHVVVPLFSASSSQEYHPHTITKCLQLDR